MNLNEQLEQLHHELGWRPLRGVWAKIEIFFGLIAASCGLLHGVWIVTHHSKVDFRFSAAASVALQSLGVYLALAGHRSHLYQSQNKLTAYLAALIASCEERQTTDLSPGTTAADQE
jgi:hypothetical protein